MVMTGASSITDVRPHCKNNSKRVRGRHRRGRPKPSLPEAVVGDLLRHRRVRHAEQPRHRRPVSAGQLQQPGDVGPLQRVQRRRFALAARSTAKKAARDRGRDAGAGEDDGSVSISSRSTGSPPARSRCAARGRCPARRSAQQPLGRRGRERAARLAHARRRSARRKCARQRQDVLAPLAQRRQRDGGTRPAGSRGPSGSGPRSTSRSRSGWSRRRRARRPGASRVPPRRRNVARPRGPQQLGLQCRPASRRSRRGTACRRRPPRTGPRFWPWRR